MTTVKIAGLIIAATVALVGCEGFHEPTKTPPAPVPVPTESPVTEDTGPIVVPPQPPPPSGPTVGEPPSANQPQPVVPEQTAPTTEPEKTWFEKFEEKWDREHPKG